MPNKDRYTLIVNPISGKKTSLAMLETIKPLFTKAGAEIEILITSHAGHASELAASIDLGRTRFLCVIGGDGTVHEVINGLMKRPDPRSHPIALIPAGTGNTVLQHFAGNNPILATQRILQGNTIPLDLARVKLNDKIVFSLNIVGWGAIDDINQKAEAWRRLGSPRYALAALAYILSPKSRKAIITIDDTRLEDEFLMAAACNTRFTGKGMQLAPKANAADGKLDIIIVRRASRLQMLSLFLRVFNGSHLDLPFVEYTQARSLEISYTENAGLTLDGERTNGTSVSVNIIPAALNIIV